LSDKLTNFIKIMQVFRNFIFYFKTIINKVTFSKISEVLVLSVRNSEFSNDHMFKILSADGFFKVINLNQKWFFEKMFF
jgi:hypothetical protein